MSCSTSLATVRAANWGAGGTISDDEDMAWGEQAQLAVEENAPHKQFPKGPGGNPKIDRRSTTGSNFMRCLPQRYVTFSYNK